MNITSGKYIAIIAAVTFDNGKGKAEGCTVCKLQMVITRGASQGQIITKRYFYQQDLPDLMKKEFLMLGKTIQSPEDVAGAVNALTGKIALISLSETDGKLRCYIESYVGSDDPAKYAPRRDPKEQADK